MPRAKQASSQGHKRSTEGSGDGQPALHRSGIVVELCASKATGEIVTNQNYADAIGLLLLIAGVALGYTGSGWAWALVLALVGTVAFLLLKKGSGTQLLSIDRLGPIGMYLLQALNALALYGIGTLVHWLWATPLGME